MPSHIIPRRQGLHRIACIALYRAILEQCARISIPDNLKQLGPECPLKHLVRKRFRGHIHITSPKQCVQALQGGYEAEEVLRKAGDGDKAAYSKIINLLAERQKQAAIVRARTPPPKKRTHIYPEPYPGSEKVLESRPRPLSQLTGRRHVPVATGGNLLPFLRFKAKQSPFLSRLIKDHIKLKQKRLNINVQLEENALLGKEEEKWENLVGEDGYKKDGKPWYVEAVNTRNDIGRKIVEQKTKTRQKAKEFLRIANQEHKLWEEERWARRRQKKLEKWEKKLAGKSPTAVTPVFVS